MNLTRPQNTFILEEPALHLDYSPQDSQPLPPLFARGEEDTDSLVKACRRYHESSNRQLFGEKYSRLANEFLPAINWAISSWDWIVTTEGCRFVERDDSEKGYHRSPYRAFTKRDYISLTHSTFKNAVITYELGDGKPTFGKKLKTNFWSDILSSYNALEIPRNPDERRLTPYSYLRCMPYEFLNEYLEERASSVFKKMPKEAHKIINLYFIHFLTEEASARKRHLTVEEFRILKEAVLKKVRRKDNLVHALLLQIERY